MITVIMPVYNGEKFLKKAIDSVLNQSYSDFEFIIINDGSTDNSKNIIENYTDKRIKKIHKENSGPIDSLNLGISLSKTDWIARMDQDDISYPNRLEEQIKYIKDDVVVIGSQANIIDKDDRVYGTTAFETEHKKIMSKLLNRNSVIIHPSVIIKKSALTLIGGYDVKMLVADDYDLWLRILKVGKIININKPLLALRKHDNNISTIKLDIAATNTLVSLAYHYKSNSMQIMSDNDYIILSEKVSILNKAYTIKLVAWQKQKELFRILPRNAQYLYLALHPNIIYNYIFMNLISVWILFRVKRIKNYR